MPPNGTWEENRKSVFGQLANAERRLDEMQGELRILETRISDKLTELTSQVTDLRVDIAGWKGRLAVWGLIGAAVVSSAVAFIFKLWGV